MSSALAFSPPDPTRALPLDPAGDLRPLDARFAPPPSPGNK